MVETLDVVVVVVETVVYVLVVVTLEVSVTVEGRTWLTVAIPS